MDYIGVFNKLKGNDSHYIRVSEERLQEEYEKAINNLTINKENRLKRTVEILKIEKSQLEAIAKDVAFLKRKYNKLKT